MKKNEKKINILNELDDEMKIKYIVFLNRYYKLFYALKDADINKDLLVNFLTSIEDLLIYEKI